MPGPIPNEKARRRNAPTIPTTELPASGREGPAPDAPAAYSLDPAGRAWWEWAWALPQACAWDDGALYVAARRAQLEDDLVVLDQAEGLDLHETRGFNDDRELAKHIEFLIRRLKGLAGGRIGVMKEMRELDNKLGLNPEALAKLRWKVVDDGAPVRQRRQTADGSKRRGRLSVVK